MQELSADCFVVALEQGQGHDRHPLPFTGAEPAGHPEINEADPAAGQEQHVARMRIGVEEPELENLAQHCRGPSAQPRRGIEAGSLKFGRGGRRMPLQEFGRQDPCRAAVANDGGYHDLVVVGEQPP